MLDAAMLSTADAWNPAVSPLGIPCELHTCCQHTLLVRPKGSDVMVLKHAIGEYTDFLTKVRPSFTPKAILEGGGNIGASSRNGAC